MDLLNSMPDVPRSKEITLLTIKQILDKAIDNNYIPKNVVKNIKLNTLNLIFNVLCLNNFIPNIEPIDSKRTYL